MGSSHQLNEIMIALRNSQVMNQLQYKEAELSLAP